jgi:hypothetical protein
VKKDAPTSNSRVVHWPILRSRFRKIPGQVLSALDALHEIIEVANVIYKKQVMSQTAKTPGGIYLPGSCAAMIIEYRRVVGDSTT